MNNIQAEEMINLQDEKDEKDKSIIEAAKRAIKNRVRQREPMQKFIQKSREMFLLQMAIDDKKEQIK